MPSLIVDPFKKGSRNKNDRVASSESISLLLNPIALRKAKTLVLALLSTIGLRLS